MVNIVKVKGRIKRKGRWLYIDNLGLVVAQSQFGYLIREQTQPAPNQEWAPYQMWVSFKIAKLVE